MEAQAGPWAMEGIETEGGESDNCDETKSVSEGQNDTRIRVEHMIQKLLNIYYTNIPSLVQKPRKMIAQ